MGAVLFWEPCKQSRGTSCPMGMDGRISSSPMMAPYLSEAPRQSGLSCPAADVFRAL